MKKRHKIIIGFLSIVILLTFSGCRTKNDGTDEEKETKEPAQKVEKKEIVVWNLFDNSDSLKGQIQKFQSANKGVTIKYKKFVNIEEYWRTILNELAEGEGPDIFAVNNNWVRQHHKKFYPLPVELGMNADIFRETFFDVAGDDLIIEEEIMGIPLSIDTLALFYNKDILRDNILNTSQPAKTWEEFEEQVYALTKQDNSRERFGVSAIAMGRGDNISRANDILYLLMLQHGTRFYDDSGEKAIFAQKQDTIEGTGKAYYPGVEALNFYTSFALPSYRNYTWNDLITGNSSLHEITPFATGKTAMIFGYSFTYEQIETEINRLTKEHDDHITLESVGISEVPQLYNTEETSRIDAYANYFPLVVSRNTDYPEEAWSFLLEISSIDSLQTYHEKTHKPTSRKDMVDTQSLEPFWGVFARQAAYSKSFQLYDLEKFNEYLLEAVNITVRGVKVTATEALQEAQEKINCILDKAQPNSNIDIDCDTLE